MAKRFLTGGLDRPLAVRDAGTALALISDRSGTVLGAMRADGNREMTVLSYTTEAYGTTFSASGTGGTDLGVGFAGAATTGPAAGFTYLRNRWYDPQTGRFLTQDPIGLAGGVNLYSYAGNNPIAFSDPFGLCPKDPGKICIAFFIQSKTTLGGVLKGDDRGFSSNSAPSQSRAYVNVDPKNPDGAKPVVNKTCLGFADTCRQPSSSNKFTVSGDGQGGFNVSVNIENSIEPGPHIDADLHFTPDGNGGYQVTGTRDGYPSLEAYYNREDGSTQVIVQQKEGKPRQLWGNSDTEVP